MLPIAYVKTKLFPENSGVSLPVFFSRAYLKLHNIYVTSKFVNLNPSTVSDLDCISLVVLKNYGPDL